jgi:hypothetical protein
MTLTMAAGFLIAMVAVREGWFGGSPHSPGSAVQSVVEEIPLANVEATSLPAKAPVVRGAQPTDHAMPAADHAVPAAGGWEMVTLEDGQAVPAQCRETLDQEMLKSIPFFIPPELRETFEESGHHVVQEREIVPVQLKDGRRLMVPVDHIQIHYVGRPSL